MLNPHDSPTPRMKIIKPVESYTDVEGFRVEAAVQLAVLKDLKKAVKRLDDGGSVSMPDDPRLLANFGTAYPNAEDPPVTW